MANRNYTNKKKTSFQMITAVLKLYSTWYLLQKTCKELNKVFRKLGKFGKRKMKNLFIKWKGHYSC